MSMEEFDFERKIRSILSDPELFPGPRRIAVMKVIAEVKCERTAKKLKKEKVPEVELQKKLERCLKRKLLEVWWDFRLKNPISAKGFVIVPSGNDIAIEREGSSP